MELLKQEDFLEKYNIKSDDFNSSGLTWEELEFLFNDYLIYKNKLETPATVILNDLMKMPNVHSVRYRIKDPEHLIEKIIRKKITSPSEEINIKNYKEKVTDLIGLRALHLFKEDWKSIHENITETWNYKDKPIANYREGDSEGLIKEFNDSGCEAKEHKFGYRSIHYIIETSPTKETFYAEIQVRTIFEEAWSEIDHTIRYPYEIDNEIYGRYLMILNRLAGSADEMGSFIKFLQNDIKIKEKAYQHNISEKDTLIRDLEIKIEKLKINQKDKEFLKNNFIKLSKFEKPTATFDNSYVDSLLKITLEDLIKKEKE